MKRYSVVVRAFNEEKYLEKTLISIRQQTVPPVQLIVVDDGSIDRTGEIAAKYADGVITLPHRGYSVAGRPELAEVVNAGLRRVRDDVDYVLTTDADHALEKNYVESLLRKMEENPRVMVVSGRVKGEPYLYTHPRGTGRLVDAKFWRAVNNLQYPVEWGWESWLYFKAFQLGYEARSYSDITTETQRPTRLGKADLWGKAMYALGYDWKYATGRCTLTFLRNPKAGWLMFWGWLLHRDVKKLDIADWVNQMQKRRFWSRVKEILRGRR